MKRFWTEVTQREENGTVGIRLDGKPMRLPGGQPLTLPPGPLADAVAAEWRTAGSAPGGTVTMEDVPLTRIAATATQRIAPEPGPTIDALARYAETDLLCYRAEFPPELAARQALLWQPWLDWSASHLGARLVAHAGVMPHTQPAEALARFRDILSACTPWRLAGLGVAVPALGSLILGIALAERRLEPDTAHELALLDEMFEVQHWGMDALAEARRRQIRQDIADAARFMALAEPSVPS
jgi:chaperone required for assembly of F1-ATPase